MFSTSIFDKGHLTVISGCMFSGKTTELLRIINLSKIAGLKVQLFKPVIDNRYDNKSVVSHDNTKMEAINISKSGEILKLLDNGVDVVGIDEVQFLDRKVVNIVNKLTSNNLNVVVAGLNTDFKGDPFGQMPTLLSLADNLIKVYAVCNKCKKAATRTQRLINGKPAKRNSPLVLVGGKENYEARCVKCHQVDK